MPNYAVAEAEYHDLKTFPDFTEIQLIDFGGGLYQSALVILAQLTIDLSFTLTAFF